MSEQYIDLAERIKRDRATGPITGLDGETYALRWLDRNPDQVPGRTITASEFDEAVESCITEDATVPPHTFAARLGVVCVPDPEPTNAEKLRADLEDIWDGNNSLNSVVQWLNDNGWVKAPGGDDD